MTTRIRVVPELHAQTPDEKVDALGPDVSVDPVDLAQYLVARDGDARIASEVLEETVLEWTQLDGPPAHADPPSEGVDLHLAEPHSPLGRLRGRRAERAAQAGGLSQLRLKAGDELAFTDGLGDVIVGAGVETAGHARLVVAPADEDDGQLRILRPQFAAELGAGGVGQHPVEQHRHGPVTVIGGARRGGAAGSDRSEALALHDRGHQLGQLGRVLDDEDDAALSDHELTLWFAIDSPEVWRRGPRILPGPGRRSTRHPNGKGAGPRRGAA